MSEYAPKEGNRYDGIYKIVKYWPEKGKTGFIVWKYLIRRDDTVSPRASALMQNAMAGHHAPFPPSPPLPL